MQLRIASIGPKINYSVDPAGSSLIEDPKKPILEAAEKLLAELRSSKVFTPEKRQKKAALMELQRHLRSGEQLEQIEKSIRATVKRLENELELMRLVYNQFEICSGSNNRQKEN